jgi:hypothetical protein
MRAGGRIVFAQHAWDGSDADDAITAALKSQRLLPLKPPFDCGADPQRRHSTSRKRRSFAPPSIGAKARKALAFRPIPRP